MSGTASVASEKTICSNAVSTFPQLDASLSVLPESAPSRTSATVTWMAYLCIGASNPSTSAATTMSWAKFVGARQLVRQDGGRLAQIAGRTRCKLPRCAHQLASAYNLLPSLQRLFGGLRARRPPACPRRRAEGEYRQRQGFLRADSAQGQEHDHRALHGRRRGAQKLW